MSRFIKVSVLFGVDTVGEENECVSTFRPTLELNLEKVGDKTMNEIYDYIRDFSERQDMLKDYTIRDATSEELQEDKEE